MHFDDEHFAFVCCGDDDDETVWACDYFQDKVYVEGNRFIKVDEHDVEHAINADDALRLRYAYLDLPGTVCRRREGSCKLALADGMAHGCQAPPLV